MASVVFVFVLICKQRVLISS